jgi:hypothetical protein
LPPHRRIFPGEGLAIGFDNALHALIEIGLST